MKKDVAQNLIKLRVANGFTQEYVAEKAGISLLAYRNIEGVKSEPNVSTLQKIAKNVYNINTAELFAEYKTQIKKVRFRALENKNIKKREDIVCEISSWLEKYNELINNLNKGDDFKYKLTELEKKTNNPIIMAKLARKEFGLNKDETVIDICNLLEFKAGIRVLAKQFNSDSFFGLSLEDINGGKLIVVNTWDRISVERRIFSVAHELGHILLHFKNINNDELAENEKEEKEANVFASHFLMPQNDFITVWNNCANCDFVDRVIRVKQIFRVSYQVVLYRLSEYVKEHNINNFDVWRTFNVSYSRKYKVKIDRKKELCSNLDENSRELRALSNQFYEGCRLAKLIKQASDENKINIDEAAYLLNLSVNDLKIIQRIWEKNPLYKLNLS